MGRYDALLHSDLNPPLGPYRGIPPHGEKPPGNSTLELNLEAPKEKERSEAPLQGSSNARPPESPFARTPGRFRRTITRYSFEFYHDQVETLKKFSLEEQLRGEKGSMSEMVRQALDMYIAKRFARTNE